MVEEVQRTVHIEVQCLGCPVGLQDMLRQKGVHQVTQNRHILWPGGSKVGRIDHLHCPVDERFFNGLQRCLAAHDKFTEGQHEVAFQRQRVFFLGVVVIALL